MPTRYLPLEINPHNRGHNWVGGIMSNPMDSPMDPLFYMHHANIDRIWSEWQEIPGNENKKSEVNHENSLLDPWADKWNISNVHKISDLGELTYSYAPVATQTDTIANFEILNRLRNLEELRELNLSCLH